jgi:hypothetical protein
LRAGLIQALGPTTAIEQSWSAVLASGKFRKRLCIGFGDNPRPAFLVMLRFVVAVTVWLSAGIGDQTLRMSGDFRLTIHSSRTCFVTAKAWQEKPATLFPPLHKSA